MTTRNEPWVLGISASHNGAVCLLKGDEIVVSVQEERLTRRKRQKIFGGQDARAISYCLDYAGIQARDLSMVVLTALEHAKSPLQDLKLNAILQVELNKIPTRVIPHHYAHAVAAFATSGFDEAAVLVVDGCGSTNADLFEDEINVIKGPAKEGWEFISLYSASGTSIKPLEKHVLEGLHTLSEHGIRMSRFRSLGLLFGEISHQVFNNSLDAGKVMGLAPCGRPTIPASEFFEIIDGQFFFYDKVQERFQHSDRWPLRQTEYQDLSCSAQVALEDAILYLVRHLHDLHPSDNLCYAGGVALNSIANERIYRETAFKDIYIMPAAEDSGPAIGAAYYGLWELTKKNARRRLVHDAMGREYSQSEIERAIADTPGVEVVPSQDVLADTVELMCAGKNIGWFQGRSELGPRALGQRSIVCDPRRPEAKDELNSKVKHREGFRPFAPVILLEESANWFDWDGAPVDSPFMLRIAKFKSGMQELVPAVVHVDGTGRVQTVTKEANGRFYELVEKFHQKTGVPIILNTSFNVMGMPIVETPQDALSCLLLTGLDYCVLGETIVKKREKILLGTDAVPGEHASNPAEEQPSEVDDGQDEITREYSLSDYAGRFESPHGTFVIHVEDGQLKSTFIGITTTLRPYSEHGFIATDPPFTGCLYQFLADKRGELDTVAVVVGPGVGETGESLFQRVREPKPVSRQVAAGLAGEYELDGQIIEAVMREDRFVVTAPGQPDYELISPGGNRFNLKNTPGYGVEFVLGEGRKAEAMLLTQPNGTFRLKRR